MEEAEKGEDDDDSPSSCHIGLNKKTPCQYVLFKLYNRIFIYVYFQQRSFFI